MIAFWTWLWGPIGLLLATPLTVCLMVISKSVSELEFINLLLSSEPALGPHHVFYQRLVAKDADEGQEILDPFLKKHSRTELFEQLLVPTLISMRHDYVRSRLNEEDQQFVFQFMRQILEEPDRDPITKTSATGHTLRSERLGSRSSPERPLIFGCPANDEADELALMMLAELLRAEQWELHVISSEMLSSERLAEIGKARPALVCIGFLPEGTLFYLRQFCKLLHSRSPELPIVVGRWGVKEPEQARDQLSGPMNAIGWTLAETKNQVIQFAQISPAATSPPQRNDRPSSEKLILSKQS